MRVGMGYDVHRLTEDRDLILGGVKIDWEKGLLGHSDADVLIHAVMDALLGAAAPVSYTHLISSSGIPAAHIPSCENAPVLLPKRRSHINPIVILSGA